MIKASLRSSETAITMFEKAIIEAKREIASAEETCQRLKDRIPRLNRTYISLLHEPSHKNVVDSSNEVKKSHELTGFDL